MDERVRGLVLVGVALTAVLAVGAVFGMETGAGSPDPVAFEDTVTVGLTLDETYGLDDRPAVELPKVQVFYSQYEYVVGYYGVDAYVEAASQAGHEQRFGYPLAIYVTDYGDTGVELNDEGNPTVDRQPAWVRAPDAWYVVGSEARTPTAPAVPSFADRADAAAFAAEYGGSVRSWEAILDTSFDRDDATTVRDRVDRQQAWADRVVANASSHADRSVSVVVGEDVDTIQAGVDTAPANTTVLVPDGTYDETLVIDRSVTLAGEGDVVLNGDGNGSVVTVTAPDVGIRNVSIRGVGTLDRGAQELPGKATNTEYDWLTVSYAGADAGITAHLADRVSIVDVDIETPANGIILRESPGAVVRNADVTVEARGTAGYAGVMLFRSPGVVESSTLTAGRDSVYLYRAAGAVVRENAISDDVLGVHLMHTDGALLADNRIEDVEDTGIYVMTGPERNAFVGNHISGADTGAYVGGTESYVARNVFEDNDVGLRMEAGASIYEANVFAGNELGAKDAAILPTNRVFGNDFVANDRHAAAGPGPLRIWTHDGRGNYWQGGTSLVDGAHPSRAYSPTDPVDGRLHRVDGAATLARAPALEALAGLQQSVSGMQRASIRDLAPTCEPNNPDLLNRAGWADEAYACDGRPVTDE
ncbi:right-handed parallel beta-helix repeat-containing protein [Salinirubellus salinus]|uniref:Right-handed parallel beta-helix repeat-containing protein n=1 Tax=Salinirubellus salinus TaxID=1364945 RepID=A0A9E7U3K5_9EURY|nr:NosD domain-containing protein [Salinirubellus salinus]UWM53355.1 right-handed parallel beta-helix repeat-containing protein [Salinirubellus salinus]